MSRCLTAGVCSRWISGLWTSSTPITPVGRACHVCWAMLPPRERWRVFKLIPLTWKNIRWSEMLIYWNGIQPMPPDGWNGSGALTSIPLWPNDFGPERLSTCVFTPVQEWTSGIHQYYLLLLLQMADVILCFDLHKACLVFDAILLIFFIHLKSPAELFTEKERQFRWNQSLFDIGIFRGGCLWRFPV